MEPLPYYKFLWRDYRSSRRVQKMDYVCRGLYRELLDEQWERGFIPNDIEALSDICGCPKKVMERCWEIISPCFPENEDGLLVNPKMELQRTSMDDKRALLSRAGQAGGSKRQANARQALANAKQMPYRREEKKQSREEKNIPAKRGYDDRSSPCREVLTRYWKHHNQTDPPWDGSEAKQLQSLLAANPSLTIQQFESCIHNRHRSTVNHAERPRSWLSRTTDYLSTPLDQYGKPLGANNGNGQTKSDRTIDSANQVLRFLDQREEHSRSTDEMCNSQGGSGYSSDLDNLHGRLIDVPSSGH